MGPFELIDLIGLDVNLSVARSFYSQGGEPERWRPSAIQERMVGEGLLGRKSGARLLRVRRRAAPRGRSRPGHRCADARPGRAGEDRPGRRGDPPPPLRPDRQRGGLRARRGGRLPGRHGHRDAARLQLAARPAGADRADRPRAARRACSKGCASNTATPTVPAPGASGLPEPEHRLVDVAPAPVLARLGRADQRVSRSRGYAPWRACLRSCRSSRCGRTPGTSADAPSCIPSFRHSSQPAISPGGSKYSTESICVQVGIRIRP